MVASGLKRYHVATSTTRCGLSGQQFHTISGMAKLSNKTLLRKRFALLRAIERDQGKVAEIDAELRARRCEEAVHSFA